MTNTIYCESTINKVKKFYNILTIILIVVTVLYGFTALADKQKPYQNKDRHHFYGQIGYGPLLTTINIDSPNNLFSSGSFTKLSSSLFAGYHYQLESTDRLRSELEINLNGSLFFAEKTLALSYRTLINNYYDISISKSQGLYITFGVGAGIEHMKRRSNSEKQPGYTGVIKLMLGTEYNLTDHFSINNLFHLSSSGGDKSGIMENFVSGTILVGVFTGFKYTF